MRICSEVLLRIAIAGLVATVNLPAAGVPAASLAATGATGSRAVWVVKVDTRSGKLVRTLIAPKPSEEANSNVRGWIGEAAKNFDVNPLLVDSVIQVESNYNPFAVSPKGAQGLMQLMPATAERFGVTNSFDPKQNIEAGVRYLKLLQDTFQDDRLAIAAYNAGEKAVARYKDVPPYPETVSYVAKVGKKYGQAKRDALSSAQANPDATQEAKGAKEPEAPRHVLGYVDPQGKLHIATQ